MKNLLIIFSFACVLSGWIMSCSSARHIDPTEYKEIEVFFVRTVKVERWVDGERKTFTHYIYRDFNGEEHELESYHTDRYILNVRR
jgi:hypothetical protein